MIRREITFELPPWLIMPLRSDFNIRIFWISSARRVEPEYDLDPALPMFPPLPQGIPANCRVRACADWLGECTNISQGGQYPIYPRGIPRSSKYTHSHVVRSRHPGGAPGKQRESHVMGGTNYFKRRVCWHKPSIEQALICPPSLMSVLAAGTHRAQP
jgi:hypothetical protein